MPEERRYQVHRRARAAQRAGDAQDEELRQEEPERDQGSADRNGAFPRNEGGGLRAGQVQSPEGRGLDHSTTRGLRHASRGRSQEIAPESLPPEGAAAEPDELPGSL